MHRDNIIILSDFGRKVTMRETKVSVLTDEIYDQKFFMTKAIDSSLKNKLKSKRLLLPELRTHDNETIAIYFDYGGESSDSLYYTYSFLVCGWNHSFGFYDFMTELRGKHNLGGKEISFKDREFGPVKRSLDEYLTGLHNLVSGFLMTIAVSKNIMETLYQSTLLRKFVMQGMVSGNQM